MCGLVGLAGDLKPEHNVIFRTLLLLNTTRGWDSTGVFRVPKLIPSAPTTSKALGTPYELFTQSREFDQKGLVFGVSKVLLGHNRYATMGAVDVDGAHPFTFDHITGAHNGTLRDWSDLEGFTTHTVDSKAIFQHISSKGIEDTWKSFTGAAALSWWNAEDQTLNLIRNDERPLHVATMDDKSVILWASEGWMLEAAVKSVPKAKLDRPTKELANPFKLKTNCLHTFSLKGHEPKLVASKDLEAREEIKNPYGFWDSWGYNSKPYRQNKPVNRRCNQGWAKGLVKAGKDTIGTIFSVNTGSIQHIRETNTTHHVINGTTENGDVIKVYPSSFNEWEDLRDGAFDKDMKNNLYVITHRPRIESEIAGHTTYRVGSDSFDLKEGFEYLSYTNCKNEACTKEEAEADLKSMVGEVCSCCDSKLTVYDNYEYMHQGYTVLCSDCNSNTKLKNMMGIYQ